MRGYLTSDSHDPTITSEDHFPEALVNSTLHTRIKPCQLHTSTMAPIPSQHSRLLARDIANYSDTELDQYLEDNGRLGLPRAFLFSKFAKVHTDSLTWKTQRIYPKILFRD